MVFKIPIGPISVNQLYFNVRGRGRVKTKSYQKWATDVFMLLPMVEVPDGDFGLAIVFGTPYYRTSDLDNMVKALVDVMQAKWAFDDVRINTYHLQKVPVKKRADAFIEFEVIQ